MPLPSESFEGSFDIDPDASNRPDCIPMWMMSDEYVLDMIERLGASRAQLILNVRQHNMITERMEQQADGSWRRKKTTDAAT